MSHYFTLFKFINIIVAVAEFILIIAVLMSRDVIFIEAVFKVALIILYLQIIKYVVLDEYVEAFRVLLSITSMVVLFYAVTLLGKELLHMSIVIVVYFVLIVLSTSRNELYASNSIALITPMFFALLLKFGKIDFLYALFLVVIIVISQINLVLSKLHLKISRVFNEKAVKPALNRLKRSGVYNSIKLLFLEYTKIFYIKTIDSITRINYEAKNLELKLYNILKSLIMRILYACSSVNLDLERTLRSAIRVLEDILQATVKTESEVEKYVSKVVQSLTRLEFIVEHFFISMLMVVVTMLLLAIVLYLISLLI